MRCMKKLDVAVLCLILVCGTTAVEITECMVCEGEECDNKDLEPTACVDLAPAGAAAPAAAAGAEETTAAPAARRRRRFIEHDDEPATTAAAGAAAGGAPAAGGGEPWQCVIVTGKNAEDKDIKVKGCSRGGTCKEFAANVPKDLNCEACSDKDACNSALHVKPLTLPLLSFIVLTFLLSFNNY